jgi:hypothetical protein
VSVLRRGVTAFWAPALLYLGIFLALNPAVVSRFSTHFLFTGPDGFQNVWNLWWVNRSAAELRLPWHTTLLHHPFGTTLLGHTLNPFNGVLAIGLLKIFTLVETYNLIVVFSFFMGGLTAYWLCRAMTGSIVGSLVGGGVFAFSSFHVAHASSHLQLVALEWLPLFLLCWIRFCDTPTTGRGVAAAGALLLVTLCDLYYFAYCVIAGVMFYGWIAWQRKDLMFLFRGTSWRASLGFLFPASLTSGMLAVALLVQNASSPFIGTHSPRELGMDLLSPFVWSESSRYRDALTFWRSLSPYTTELSVYVGLSVVALALYTLSRPSRRRIRHLGFWGLVCAFFAVMSLGTNLHVAGHEVSFGLRGTVFGRPDVNLLVLPYAVFWVIFPPWRLAGVPARMMVMVHLVTAVITAGGIQALLDSTSRWRRMAVAAVIGVVILDLLPMPLGMTRPEVPAYVQELKRLPAGAVLDLASDAPQALFYQTVHEKPMVFGYVSRLPRLLFDAEQVLVRAILDGRWESVANEYQVKYVVKRARAAELLVMHLNGAPLPEIDASRRIYQDADLSIYAF